MGSTPRLVHVVHAGDGLTFLTFDGEHPRRHPDRMARRPEPDELAFEHGAAPVSIAEPAGVPFEAGTRDGRGPRVEVARMSAGAAVSAS